MDNTKKARYLITGAAGFIGFHASKALLEMGHSVTGIDNLNHYYDPALKEARLTILRQFESFTFVKADICDSGHLLTIFESDRPEYVLHFAAQAGVRHSISHPHEYTNSNIIGFLNILESCKTYPVKHLVYASSSSVYGNSDQLPLRLDQQVDHPISLYAATKKSNELMAHVYSHLHNIPTTGLRLFTVFGPYGRPDMAYYSFTQKILAHRPIQIYNHGQMLRDFTYVEDAINAIAKIAILPPKSNTKTPPYRLLNIANSSPVTLVKFLNALENAIGKKAIIEMVDMQAGDVKSTHADITELVQLIGPQEKTPLEKGLSEFVEWYKAYYH